METSLQELWNSINEAVLIYGLKVLGALITLIIGSWVIKKLVKTFGKTLTKKGVDPTLIPTLKGVVKVALWGGPYSGFCKTGRYRNFRFYCSIWSCRFGHRFGTSRVTFEFCRRNSNPYH